MEITIESLKISVHVKIHRILQDISLTTYEVKIEHLEERYRNLVEYSYLYLAWSPIGDKGCKYLSSVNFVALKKLSLGNALVTQNRAK
jgi:hypothetical protein